MDLESLKKKRSPASNRPYVGVAVLLWKKDRLLLGQRINSRGKHCWQFPGGYLEIGESVLECAAREVREETGLKIAFAEHAGFTDELFSSGDRDYVTLYITATYLSGEPKIMEPDKCRYWQWFSYDQLPAPLFSPITNFMKQVPDLSVLRISADNSSNEQK